MLALEKRPKWIELSGPDRAGSRGSGVKHLAPRVARAWCKSQSGELRYSHKEVVMVKKTQKPKTRNWMAVQAHFKSGAGNHSDKKKAASKNACRNKKNWE